MNKEIQILITQIEQSLAKIHPLPWKFYANYPFDIQVRKPRESLSKHTEENPCSWHYEDGLYVALIVNTVPKLVEEIKRLNKLLEENSHG